jgi:hypothetical protein
MKPRDLFGVGVRLFGLWFAVECISYLIGFLIRRFENYDNKLQLATPVPYDTYNYGFFAVLYGLLAVYCLFFTEHLGRLTYGEDRLRLEEGSKSDQAAPRVESPEQKSVGTDRS